MRTRKRSPSSSLDPSLPAASTFLLGVEPFYKVSRELFARRVQASVGHDAGCISSLDRSCSLSAVIITYNSTTLPLGMLLAGDCGALR
jgi:hypothetical protein